MNITLRLAIHTVSSSVHSSRTVWNGTTVWITKILKSVYNSCKYMVEKGKNYRKNKAVNLVLVAEI